MTHLTPDEVVDAVEDALGPDRADHLASCDVCRASVDDLARLLRGVAGAGIPEPSPLFWHHFSARVRAAIAEEPPRVASDTAWRRWSVLVPVAGLAAVVTVLALAMPRHAGPPMSVSGEGAIASLDLAERADDASWAFVAEAAGEVSLDEAERAGLTIAPGAAERAVATLNPAERAELTRLLTEALAAAER